MPCYHWECHVLLCDLFLVLLGSYWGYTDTDHAAALQQSAGRSSRSGATCFSSVISEFCSPFHVSCPVISYTLFCTVFSRGTICYQNVHTIDLEIIYWSVYFVTFTIESTQYHCLSNDFSYLQVTAFECRTRWKNVRVHDTNILSAASIYDCLGNYLDIMNWFISGLASWTSTTRRADADARAQASPPRRLPAARAWGALLAALAAGANIPGAPDLNTSYSRNIWLQS